MPLVDESVLLVVEAFLQGLGAVILGVVLLHAMRDGGWRNPLERTGFTGVGPGVPALLAVFVTYYILVQLGLNASRNFGILSGLNADPGSRDSHVLLFVDSGAKLLASGLIIMFLSRRRAFAAQPASWERVGRVVAVGAAAWLVILPIVYVQLDAIQAAWRHLAPNVVPPQHSVLEAIQHSVWGRWGAVHLVATAVVIAPLTEELFFRGLVLQAAWGLLDRAWAAVAISAVMFGLIHFTQPQVVLPLATMGLVLGYIRVRYRSIGACVVAHGLFNALTMAVAILNPEMATRAW